MYHHAVYNELYLDHIFIVTNTNIYVVLITLLTEYYCSKMFCGCCFFKFLYSCTA